MNSMIATPWAALMLTGAVTAVVLALGVLSAAWGGKRCGLQAWALALGLQALVCALLWWRAPFSTLGATLGGGVLASASVAAVQAALARLQGLAWPWAALLAPPLAMALGLWALQGEVGPSAVLTGAVLAGQIAWALWTLLERRPALPERGAVLVLLGLGSLMALHAALAVAGLAGLPDPHSLLADPAVQTTGALWALASWQMATLGFVLLGQAAIVQRPHAQAALDADTGIANRRSIIAALDRDVARAIRTRLPVAILMVELDPLRTGALREPAAAQTLLCGMVDLVQNRVRAQDLLGRYGDTELLVVLPDTTAQGAVRLAQQLCLAARTLAPLPGDPPQPVTASVGVWGARLHSGDSWDQLIYAAEQALQRARSSGGNRVELSAGLVRLGPMDPTTTATGATAPASL